MSTADDVILSEVRGAVAILTINRPKTLNALDVPTLLVLEKTFATLEADDTVRVIVVTGAGEKAFVAGGDISDLNSRGGLTHYQEFAETIHRVFRAKEIMFSGKHFPAETALEIGLINRIVEPAQLMPETLRFAEEIAAKSPLILKILKRTLTDGADMTLTSALAHEKAMASIVFDSADAHEGCSAFLEKRKPVFTGK